MINDLNVLVSELVGLYTECSRYRFQLEAVDELYESSVFKFRHIYP
jgi:hypothetical protein